MFESCHDPCPPYRHAPSAPATVSKGITLKHPCSRSGRSPDVRQARDIHAGRRTGPSCRGHASPRGGGGGVAAEHRQFRYPPVPRPRHRGFRRDAAAGPDPGRGGRPAICPFRTRDAGTPASPNGNSVSLELEMLRGIEAQRAHSRAIRVIWRGAGPSCAPVSGATDVCGVDRHDGFQLGTRRRGQRHALAGAAVASMCRRTSPMPTRPATAARSAAFEAERGPDAAQGAVRPGPCLARPARSAARLRPRSPYGRR